MANFIQVAGNVTSPRGRAVIADVLNYSKVLNQFNLLSAFELDTFVSTYRPFMVSNTLQTREAGSSFNYSYSAPPSAQSVTQAITGAAVVIDRTYYRDAALGGNDFNVWFEKEIKRRARDYAQGLDVALLAGTGTSGAVKGLSAILNGTTDVPGLTGFKGVVNAATYSTISSAKSMDLRYSESTFDKEAIAFKELLLQTLADMDNPSVMILNRTAFARIQTIAGKLGLLGSPTNDFIKTPSIAGLQTIVLNSDAIPNNEPDDTATTPLEVTSSIYLLSPAEMQCSLLTNGFDYLEAPQLEAKEAGEEKWEMGIAWKIETPAAIRRIRNLRV